MFIDICEQESGHAQASDEPAMSTTKCCERHARRTKQTRLTDLLAPRFDGDLRGVRVLTGSGDANASIFAHKHTLSCVTKTFKKPYQRSHRSPLPAGAIYHHTPHT
jgi:hypothetical protein